MARELSGLDRHRQYLALIGEPFGITVRVHELDRAHIEQVERQMRAAREADEPPEDG